MSRHPAGCRTGSRSVRHRPGRGAVSVGAGRRRRRHVAGAADRSPHARDCAGPGSAARVTLRRIEQVGQNLGKGLPMTIDSSTTSICYFQRPVGRGRRAADVLGHQRGVAREHGVRRRPRVRRASRPISIATASASSDRRMRSACSRRRPPRRSWRWRTRASRSSRTARRSTSGRCSGPRPGSS